MKSISKLLFTDNIFFFTISYRHMFNGTEQTEGRLDGERTGIMHHRYAPALIRPAMFHYQRSSLSLKRETPGGSYRYVNMKPNMICKSKVSMSKQLRFIYFNQTNSLFAKIKSNV